MDVSFNGFTAHSFKNRNGGYQYSRNIEAQEDAKNEGFSEEALVRIPEKDRRWSWVEVSRSAIQYNVSETRRLLGQRCRLMAVVKADAYGHGANEVAKIATAAGASYLGVATVDEGIELRKADFREPILLLAEPPIESVPLLLHYRIIPSVYTSDFAINYAEIADAHNLKAPFHLAINTGMNRIGVRHDQVVEKLDLYQAQATAEMAGRLKVLPGGKRMPMGMVVGDDDGGGVVFERLGEDQPGVDLSGVDAALEHGRAVQELAPIVQAEQDDRLVLQPEKPGQQIVAEILRTGQDDAVLVLVLIIPPEQLAAKAKQHSRVRRHPLHTAQLLVFRLEYAGQAAERIHQTMSKRIRILAGNAVIQQHLEQLVGVEAVQAGLEKLLFEPLTVPVMDVVTHKNPLPCP